MKKILFIITAILVQAGLSAQQNPLPFQVELEEIVLPQAPALQSYAFGVHDGKWIFMGGRISGLHGHNPFNSFPPDSANKHIWMVDIANSQVWSVPVSTLPAAMDRQLQATNPVFTQKDSTLYVIGGYGYDNSSNQYDTWPNLLVVDLGMLHDALIQGSGAQAALTQIQDNRLAVTGGHLSYDDSLFYLVGGQKFTGRYNPHGMPSYTQTYTNAIRTFTIAQNGANYSIQNYSEITDSQELHRRDYNMADQVFPDGSFGFTAFSGVFRHNVDLPWFNIVDIHDQTYNAVSESEFKQLFNQYHGARVPVYDIVPNEMHTIFFGGIGMYTWDSINQVAVEDTNVPFVKTISMVTRYADSTLEERVFPASMPAYLGASAEFIRAENVTVVDGEVIDYMQLPLGKSLIGYIYGGIQSTQPNIFMQPTGSSHATNRIFKVYLISPPFGLPDKIAVERLEVFPNPSGMEASVYLPWKHSGPIVSLYDSGGIWHEVEYSFENSKLTLQLSTLPPGIYFLRVDEKNMRGVAKIVKY